ncbi:ABC transporter substrate-binding protein [Vibrio metoecus]|uniref:ABC transporter substrate-binding protein n=1 Tax=Vibrio metoecus TaxID=1481663 RepID=UPI00215C2957|nr:ABC transporter substrate-binding protein [Vibrio metoecus]MCR9388042.1 ABC transporter substrate-binding protein [Vibrio metoecus]
MFLVRQSHRWVVYLLSVAMALGLWLWWKPLLNSTASVTTLVPIKIAVSQTPLSSPFYIADQLGFFREQGINVELVACSGGVQCSQALLKGDVSYATASESVVMFTSFERQDFEILASFVQSDNDVKLLALKENEIHAMGDLQNKRIGMIKASSSEFYFDSLLLVNNLKGIPLNKVYGSPEELYQKLFDKQLDAVSIWEPWGYKIDVAANSQVTNLGLPGIYTLSFNLLTMKNTPASEKQNTLAILKALKQAISWMHQNPEKTLHRVAGVLNIDEKQLQWSWQDYSFRLSLGNTLLTNLQLQGRWALDSRLVLGEMPDYRQLMADELFLNVTQSGGAE